MRILQVLSGVTLIYPKYVPFSLNEGEWISLNLMGFLDIRELHPVLSTPALLQILSGPFGHELCLIRPCH